MAGSGFVDPNTLHSWVVNAGQALGWKTGGMCTTIVN